jgi:hypothetical protein
MVPFPPGPDSFTYTLDGTIQTFALPSFLFSSLDCSNPYTIEVVRTDASSTIPFYWNTTGFSLQSNNQLLAGVSHYRIDASETTYCASEISLKDSSYKFTLTLSVP